MHNKENTKKKKNLKLVPTVFDAQLSFILIEVMKHLPQIEHSYHMNKKKN
jgi:hypothetical protein